MTTAASAEDRLRAKSRTMPSGCIEWTGHLSKWCYGEIIHEGKTHGVHRMAWMLVNGLIPKGMLVCHSCDNPKCFNVEHLWLGTNTDNARDSVAKDRHFNTNKTHCAQGHPFNEANTYFYKDRRKCRVCNREIVARRKQRKVEG